jgi:hypothetical protein
MQKSTKYNRYKFSVGETGFILINEDIVEFKVIKRLKRPHRLSDNFYFCNWNYHGTECRGIHFENEMYKDKQLLIADIKNGKIKFKQESSQISQRRN